MLGVADNAHAVPIVPGRGSNQVVVRVAQAAQLPAPFCNLGFTGVVVHTATRNGFNLKEYVHEKGGNYDFIGMQCLREVNWGKNVGFMQVVPPGRSFQTDWLDPFQAAFTTKLGSEPQIIRNDFVQPEMMFIPDRMFNRVMAYFSSASGSNLAVLPSTHMSCDVDRVEPRSSAFHSHFVRCPSRCAVPDPISPALYQQYYVTPPMVDAALVSTPLESEAPPSPAMSTISQISSPPSASASSSSSVAADVAALQADSAHAKEEMAKINTNMAGMLAILQELKRARA